MSKIMRILICLSFLMISASSGYAMMIAIPRLPDYIAKVPVIVEGHIRMSDGKSILIVDRFLKGSASNAIIIERDTEWAPAIKIVDGERVILFFAYVNPDGTKALLYNGNISKWPRQNDGFFVPTTYLTDDMTRFGAVINALIYAMDGKDFEERARRIISMTKSPDEMLQLAGLQLMTSSVFSKTLADGNNWQKLTQIAAFMLPLLKSENPEIRIEAAAATRHAPVSVAAPALIPLLTDPARNVSQSAASVLGMVFGELKLPRPVVVPSKLQFGEKLASVDVVQFRQNARNWSEAVWSEKADTQIAKDLVRLHKSLESGSALERESAQIYINILEGTSVVEK